MEIEDYLDAAERLEYLPMFMLVPTTGLRQRELIALKWSDLDPTQRTLTIHEGRAVVRGQLVDYGGEIRTLRLTEDMTALLQWEHDRHPSSPLLFMHPGTQKPFTPMMVRRMHDEIIRETGLDHIRFEDLRHTCAVNALQNGMEIRELSQILGHARTAQTQLNYGAYIGQPVPTAAEVKCEEPELEELKEASAQLENLLAL